MAERFPSSPSEPLVPNPSNPHQSIKESLTLRSRLLAEVSKELGTIHFDVKTILPDLQENGILLPDEIDLVRSETTRSGQRVALFHGTLPNKRIEQLARMYLTLRAKDEDSQLVKLLGEKLGVLDEFRASIQVSEPRQLENPRSLNPVVLRLKEELKKLFDHSTFKEILPIPTLPDFSFPIDHIWVDLKMERTDKKAWKEVAQNEFPSVLRKALANPVLVLGDPGIGKSTFWKRMCREWAFGGLFSEYDLILPCRLRDVENCETILELALTWLEKILPDKHCVEAFRCWDFLMNLKVLVILDGFDEYRSACTELNLLFNKEKVLSFSLLITSRPKAIKFGEVKWRLLKIGGLNLHNIQLYIAKAFKIHLKDIDNHDEASGVFRAIQQRPNLREMAHIPLLLSYLCLAPEAREADTTTEVYKHLISFVVKTHNRKNLGKEEDFSFSDPRLRELAKLALNGLLAKSEQLVFDQTQLARIDQHYLDAGLLARETSAEQQTMEKANFPHKTIQEFLAAVGMVLAMEEGRRSFFAPLWMIFHHWSIISGLGSVDRVSKAEYPARLEQTMLFFIGITSEPSYPYNITAQKFLKAFLASAHIHPFILTAYLRESKSIAFSKIIITHLNNKDITFTGSPSNMASFIRDAPDLKIPSFKWIISESFDLNNDLLKFKPKKSAKLQFKSFHVQIELKAFENPHLQHYLAEFVKVYFSLIVIDKMKISSEETNITLDIHLYEAFSAVSRSSEYNFDIAIENVCDHSLKGMVQFLRNMKMNSPLTSIVWNVDCTDFDPELLNFEATKPPLDLEHLRLRFVSDGFNPFPHPVAEQQAMELFNVASKLLQSRRLCLSSKQTTTINTCLFLEIYKLTNECLGLRMDNVCLSGSQINIKTSLWELDTLRISINPEAETNSLALGSEENETELKIYINDESMWNSLSSLFDLVLKKPRVLYFGDSVLCIAMQMGGLSIFYDFEKLVLNDPQGQKTFLEWVMDNPWRWQDLLERMINEPQKLQDTLELIMNDQRRSQCFLEWKMNDLSRRLDFLDWTMNDTQRKQDFWEWNRNNPRRRNYFSWSINDPRKSQYLLEWTMNDPLRRQDFKEWTINDTRNKQYLLEWTMNDQRGRQFASAWFQERLINDPMEKKCFQEWLINDLMGRQCFLEWMMDDPKRMQKYLKPLRIRWQRPQDVNRNNLVTQQDVTFWKALSTFVHQRSTQPFIIDIIVQKEEICNAIVFMKQLTLELKPPLKDPLLCTFKGEKLEDLDTIQERCLNLSGIEFIIVISSFSLYSEVELHVFYP